MSFSHRQVGSRVFADAVMHGMRIAAMLRYRSGIPLRRAAMIGGFVALYIFMLAAFTGYEIISRVPVILHTPLMSGSNFVHGIVLVGAMVALGHAQGAIEIAIGVIAVLLAAGNVAGGYVVTERMLEMFKTSKPGTSSPAEHS